MVTEDLDKRRLEAHLVVQDLCCDGHFLEQDIIKQDEFIIGGNVVNNPRTNCKLNAHAVPSIFEGRGEWG